MASVHAVGHVLDDGIRFYHFNVVFDTENWVVTKCYDDFVDLRKELEEAYSHAPEQVPYLTGEVRPWARNSEKTAEGRLPKLELFLMELLGTRFHPDIFDVNVPFMSRNVKDYSLCKFAFEFLEFATHYKPHSSPVRVAGGAAGDGFVSADAAEGAGGEGGAEGGEGGAEPPRERTAAELAQMERDREEREREAEIKGLLEKQKASVDAIAKSNEAQGRTSITSQINIKIPSYEIFERDRIDYVVSVDLWDRTWQVSKRYSDFVNLYNELMDIYGETTAVKPKKKTRGGGAAAGDKAVAALDDADEDGWLDIPTTTSTRYNTNHVSAFKASDPLPPPPSLRARARSLAPSTLAANGAIIGDDADGQACCVVQSIEASKAPFYKKLDPETGKMRQLFFEAYLRRLAAEIDTWEPKGLIAMFHVQAAEGEDGTEGLYAAQQSNSATVVSNNNNKKIINVAVSVNKVLFDFLDFQDHMATINAYVARRVLAKQSEQLPEAVRAAMAAKLEADRRLKVIGELQHRQRTRRVVSDAVVSDLLDVLPQLQEDRDVINSIRYVTEFGTVCRDLRSLDGLYGGPPADAAANGPNGSKHNGLLTSPNAQQQQRKIPGGVSRILSSSDSASSTYHSFASQDYGANPFFARGEIGRVGSGSVISNSGGANPSKSSGKPSGSKRPPSGSVKSSGAAGRPPRSGGGGGGGDANAHTHAAPSVANAAAGQGNAAAVAAGGGGGVGFHGIGVRRLAGTNGAANANTTGAAGANAKTSFGTAANSSSLPPTSGAPRSSSVYGSGGGGGGVRSDDDEADFYTGGVGDKAAGGGGIYGSNVSVSSNSANAAVSGTPTKNSNENRPASATPPTSPAAQAEPAATAATATGPVGLSSAQAARIAEAIYFNDTRREGIAAMAAAIVDDKNFSALFGTLIYEWDESRTEVEELLIKAYGDRDRSRIVMV